MFKDEKEINVNVQTLVANDVSPKFHNADDELLAELGYKAEFKREFSVRANLVQRKCASNVMSSRC